MGIPHITRRPVHPHSTVTVVVPVHISPITRIIVVSALEIAELESSASETSYLFVADCLKF